MIHIFSFSLKGKRSPSSYHRRVIKNCDFKVAHDRNHRSFLPRKASRTFSRDIFFRVPLCQVCYKGALLFEIHSSPELFRKNSARKRRDRAQLFFTALSGNLTFFSHNPSDHIYPKVRETRCQLSRNKQLVFSGPKNISKPLAGAPFYSLVLFHFPSCLSLHWQITQAAPFLPEM